MLSVSRVKRRIGGGLLATVLLSAALYGQAQPQPATAKVDLIGINLSAAGFAGQVLPAWKAPTTSIPPRITSAATRPRASASSASPFLWERVQPQLGGELDQAQVALLQRTLDFADKYGIR